jgi:hypothetical protein
VNWCCGALRLSLFSSSRVSRCAPGFLASDYLLASRTMDAGELTWPCTESGRPADAFRLPTGHRRVLARKTHQRTPQAQCVTVRSRTGPPAISLMDQGNGAAPRPFELAERLERPVLHPLLAECRREIEAVTAVIERAANGPIAFAIGGRMVQFFCKECARGVRA